MTPQTRMFHKIVQQLEDEFRVQFLGKPTAETQSLQDRIRRSLSWLARADRVPEEDKPPRFVDLWIGLNALYGCPPYRKEYARTSQKTNYEKEQFESFMEKLIQLHSAKETLCRLMKKRHIENHTCNLIQEKHLWNECWDRNFAVYEDKCRVEINKIQRALRHDDAVTFFTCLFGRLQVLRNQIFHGSSSATTRRSRGTLYPAILLLEEILPEFIQLMMHEGPETGWPPIPYPGSESPQYPM